MIFRCQPVDRDRIYLVINEAATAYRGKIPVDCYRRPYMTMDELEREMERIIFYGWKEGGEMVGLMGIEPVGDVTLIRHSYVLPRWQRQGISSRLLDYLKGLVTTRRLLVGTWADASWAIAFYERRGFRLVPDKDELLKRYWDIPERQIETSVVLGLNLLF